MSVSIKVNGTPGCGKTYTLISFYRMCLSLGYSANEITVISYRKSSAQDLRDETNKYANIDKTDLHRHVGTLHSICYRLIGRPQMLKSSDLIDFAKQYGYASFTSKYQIKKEDEEGYFDVNAQDDTVDNNGDLFAMYAWCRATLTPPEKWFRYPGAESISLPSSRVPEFFKNYDAYKRKVDKIDFSDMLQRVIDNKILLDTPILMVDEFQDLTPQMYKIFEMWSIWCDKVIIAGDPFQSIYGFSGGSPDFFNKWYAKEIVLHRSRRLPAQIKNYSQKILKSEGMVAPDVIAKNCDDDRIHLMEWTDEYPIHDTELHLIRCNYQAYAIAMLLASEGKVFGGIRRCAWTEDEVNLVNAIIQLKKNKPLTGDQIKAVLHSFPAKFLGIKNVEEFIEDKFKDSTVFVQYQDGVNSILSKKVIERLKSNDPTDSMKKTSELFKLKINCLKDGYELIDVNDIKKRRLMTIHGSKGLEADAVFLHTAITPRIKNQIVIAGTEGSKTEARVWYVGVTRAREHLYIVTDKGDNYDLPKIPKPNEKQIDFTEMTESLDYECLLTQRTYVMADW